jgi:hypothetical protein
MSYQNASVKQKKETNETKELLLYQWVRIVKEIFPRTRIENPYQSELASLSEKLDITERFLLEDLLEAITLMNKSSRENEQGELITSKEDLLNAIQLITPKGKRITSKSLDILGRLETVFEGESFTYHQALTALKVSHSTIKRQLAPLIKNGDIIRLKDQKQGFNNNRALLQLVLSKESLIHQEEEIEEENMFSEAMGEWTEFQGFVDLQYRT